MEPGSAEELRAAVVAYLEVSIVRSRALAIGSRTISTRQSWNAAESAYRDVLVFVARGGVE